MQADPPETQNLPAAEAVPVPAPAPTPADAPAAETMTAAGDTPPAESTQAAGDMSPAACGAKLAELFPALFAPPAADTPATLKPMKLRIQADIQARAPGVFSKRILGLYFSRYSTSNAYLKALTQAPSRYDLDGEPAGEIDIEHRTAAVQELARRHEVAKAKRAERFKAERAAQRPVAASSGSEGDATRPPQEHRPPRPAHASHATRKPPRSDRPEAPSSQARPQAHSQGAPRQEHRHAMPRPPRQPRPEGDRRHTTNALPPDRPRANTDTAMEPADPAQRERAVLLRNFESSSLSKANFCALKRISEAELDASLAQARAERDARRR